MSGLEVLYHPHFEPDIATLRSTLLISDVVHSIVPTGSGFTPSEPMSRHVDSLPGTFIPTAPENDDVDIVKDYWVLDALKRSFGQISTRKPNNRVKAKLIALSDSLEETLELNDAALLHNFKVTYVVYDALKEHGLIYEERDDGYFLVDAQAAHFIVSFLAQRMSHRLAMRTLTGVDVSFLLSTACDVYDGVIPDSNALFASAVLRAHPRG